MIDLYKDILRNVEDLATCSYSTEAFSDLLGKIQASVCPAYSLLSSLKPHVSCADRQAQSRRLCESRKLGR